MRKTLNAVYEASAWMAALLMIGVLMMVLLSIVSRLLHFHVPGTDAYAGYAMAGAGFMALAHTLKRGEHIRVTLILGRLKGVARHRLELWALTVASVLSLLLSFLLGDWLGNRMCFTTFQRAVMPHRCGFLKF
jgi:TRAP-type C4-dicarboxylate transport system permease small subunit